MPCTVSEFFNTDCSHLSLIDLSEDCSDRNVLDEEDSPSLFINSPYYKNDEFINVLDTKKDFFSIMSLNIQSLNAKISQLRSYIELYRNL